MRLRETLLEKIKITVSLNSIKVINFHIILFDCDRNKSFLETNLNSYLN